MDGHHDEPRAQFKHMEEGTAEVESALVAHSKVAEAAVVAVSCFPFDVASQTRALAEALTGSVVAVDPNPREGMLHDRAEFVRGFEALAATADLVKVGDDNCSTFFRKELCGDVTHTRPTPDNHGNFSCEPHVVHAIGPQCGSQPNGPEKPRGALSCLVTQLVVATQVVHNNGGTKIQSQKTLTT